MLTAPPDLGLDGKPHLVFQPAADLATGRLLGFEALLRWCDGSGGLIPPERLIPWAEAHGQVSSLNAWVLKEACSQAARWPLHLQIAVNCSLVHLGRAASAVTAAEALEVSDLVPDRLTIEITESAIDDDEALADLNTMARLGIQLTVDDVGTDWSVLDRLPPSIVSTIKMDEPLIRNLDASEGSSRSIVEAIVRFSRSKGICTVAEAVETDEQVAVLRELGADVAQGYFFSVPVGADEAFVLASGESPPRYAVAASTEDRSDQAAATSQSITVLKKPAQTRNRRPLRRGNHSRSRS
jgi:EAL domain-containing protein (putative c-di-GMP-specific phosphodiesterase class I)